jgi:hypothetical protein
MINPERKTLLPDKKQLQEPLVFLNFIAQRRHFFTSYLLCILATLREYIKSVFVQTISKQTILEPKLYDN